MNKKLRYPMEAFAFAMILFSSGLKVAMIVGIGLIFGDILQGVIGEWSDQGDSQSLSAVGALVTGAALYLMFVLVGITPGWKEIAGFAVLGVLLMKHSEMKRLAGIESDYNDILFADSFAYGAMGILATIREYLAEGSVFGIYIGESDYMSAALGQPMFALVLSGLVVALLNLIFKEESEENAALWVCIPTLLLETPFIWNHVPELFGTIVGILMTAVIYLTFRRKLLFSDTGKVMKGIPVETVTLGMIYMVMTLL